MPDRPPLRIQRKRTRGWRMPEGAVYVGRPSVWGNRWRIGDRSNHLGHPVQTKQEAADLFRDVGWSAPHQRAFIRENLRGHDLACWCKLCPEHAAGKPFDVRCKACEPCHADVLGVIANG